MICEFDECEKHAVLSVRGAGECGQFWFCEQHAAEHDQLERALWDTVQDWLSQRS